MTTAAKARRFPLPWIAGGLCGAVFFLLLAVRLGVFGPAIAPLAVPDDGIAAEESWYRIVQHGRRIGWSHRRYVPVESGYEVRDTTRMRITTMAMSQDIRLNTRGYLNPDLTLKRFDFELESSRFQFQARGEVRNNRLRITAGGQQFDIPVEDGLYLVGGVTDRLRAAGLQEGESRSFPVFDPTSMGRRQIRVRREVDETVNIAGRSVSTHRYSLDFMGSRQTVWVDPRGGVVREEGLMGIRLERVDRLQAVGNGELEASEDLTRMVSVAVDRDLPAPQDLTRLRVRLTGLPKALDIDGGRQTLQGSVLSVALETLPPSGKPDPAATSAFLAPTPLIQSDHPRIGEQVAAIVRPEDPPVEKARKLMDWIARNIEKRPVLSIPDALETLENRVGDCNEHSVLLAAMARAAGIPAQVEAGLVYTRGRFYYHAWNVLHLGQWVTADALMNQMPADVTHLRLVRGESDRQLDLIGVIGKLGIQIEEAH